MTKTQEPTRKQRLAAASELPDSIARLVEIEGPDDCWVHRSGPMGQTRASTGVRRVAYVVLEQFRPEVDLEGEHARSSAVGLSIKSGDGCVSGNCINPWHLDIMSRLERAALAKREAGAKTPYRGILWHGATDRWTSQLIVDGVSHHGRYHEDPLDAALEYDGLVARFAPGRPTNASLGLFAGDKAA